MQPSKKLEKMMKRKVRDFVKVENKDVAVEKVIEYRIAEG